VTIAQEFAVMLPDGLLLQELQQRHNMFGQCISEQPVGPRIYRTRAEAEHVVNELRGAAMKIGVQDLLAVVVTRYCGPWSSPFQAEVLAQQFLTYIDTYEKDLDT